MKVSEDVNIEQLKALAKLVEKHNLTELTVEENGLTITIKGTEAQAQVVYAGPAPVESEFTAEQEIIADVEVTPEEPAANVVRIESPMVGVFYRASSPDSPPFAEVGDTIEVGQPIGLIEAMKVFSEVPSEIAGVILEMPVENAKLVQQGDVLAVVRVD
jgi:acetyl-CoA carboxylase biotin carboxyl carrier protein